MAITKTCARSAFGALSRSACSASVAGPRTFTRSAVRNRPSNVGNLGLAEKDAVVGKQAREPLTIEGIKARRLQAGKLVAPTASYSDSDMFKSPQAFDQPKAKRWDHLLSEESLAREPCMLKQAAKHLKKPGMISLGGGLPSPDNFPIEGLSMTFAAPPDFNPDVVDDGAMGKYDVRDKGGIHDLSIALNYHQSVGAAQLLRFVTEHTELVFRPPYGDWRCSLTIGSTGALEQALRMFCDRRRGDSILTDEFSFSTALETAWPIGIRVVGAKMDEQGPIPESMDEILSTWDPAAHGGARKPTLLYAVPCGQNPTGATLGVQRRKDVYEVCRRHDLYIIEDDPYYFIQMQPYTGAGGPPVPPPATVEEYLEGLIPSLVSIDTDGRVMRMDSFSKVFVPGSRVGWITASEQIVERYIRHAECASQGPSGISQLLLYKLLDESWGHEGYLKWLMHLGLNYTSRRNAILAACEKFLPRDVVSWTPPAAGMFLWLKVDHAAHPDIASRSLLEIEDEIFNLCIEKGVLAVPGSWFRPDREQAPTGLYFRMTYAAASEADMARGVERFGAAVRESFHTA